MYDILYVCETIPRGRPIGEAAGLVTQGATAAAGCRVELVMEEQAAVGQALAEAQKGDLLVLLVEDVDAAIEQLRARSVVAATAVGS